MAVLQDAPLQLGVRPSDPRTLRCPACDTPYPFIQFARDVMSPFLNIR